MSVTQRVLKLGVLAVLAATVTGCIVLPYGARGRHGHGGYHAASSEAQPAPQRAPLPYGQTHRR